MRTWTALLLVACAGPAAPGPEDCLTRASGRDRDACLLAALPERFATDPVGAEKIANEAISDPLVRDLLFLQVARRLDPLGDLWCRRIEAAALADRCRALARRPHLSRDQRSVPGPPSAPKLRPAP